MASSSKLQKINSVLFFCFLLIIGLYYGSSFLIPLTFGIFFTTLVLPISAFFEKKLKFGRMLSSFVSTFILFLVVGGLFFLLIRQFSMFVSDLLERKEDILGFIDNLREQVVQLTGITLEQQEEVFKDRIFGMIQELQKHLSNLFNNFVDILMDFLVMLIYVFLFLLYRDQFFNFFMKYASSNNNSSAEKIINESKTVANRYLWGRVQVMIALAIMYPITFLAYNLEYSALLIIFGVLITIVPYIGPFVSGLLPVLFMVVFSDSSAEIISFAAIVLVIQLVESYVLEPIIIGSEVKQSPLFIIIAIVLGSVIWGFAGLVLFVPLFAIMKIIFDHTPGLEPLGVLIGYKNDKPSEKN
ncbi:AI-2E family transporter [Psychroflexus sp. CAK8W]|uniref:AI-2E family transporter n=1 Tax=Psychroflexus longus TaxID=2873596 RepID=A0ABS7XJ31_9FLAO|nr:AI-2E family transporter [Psychroflexus longus]MBZ9778977.1 AI-2E family transporter [Psychroflexus longus]